MEIDKDTTERSTFFDGFEKDKRIRWKRFAFIVVGTLTGTVNHTLALQNTQTCNTRSLTLKIHILALFLVFLSVLFIGAAVEKAAVDEADSTLYFYATPKVCAVDTANYVLTYEGVDDAHAQDGLVIHCGDCGSCSNDVDIGIYEDTKETLTETSTRCAKKAFLGGRGAVYECFTDDVGFTDECNECWTDNVMCDMKKCVFTCVKMLIFGGSNNNEDGSLNDCLLCDEKRCGPAYIECAGANRRKSGIVSAIGRDDENEVCGTVDAGWEDRFD